ncbi:MAG: hypothetical protein KKF50_04575 [Nanoarchaeota archaeon]|nr:hypothetical protein [Nanoarchaeota archaeon]
MENKRGAEMTIGTIVIIVLAIAVLVFLIFGFTTGWSNLWDRIGIYGGSGENINDLKVACAAACAQGDSYGFNDKVREVWNEDKMGNKAVTCKDLVGTVKLTNRGKAVTAPVMGAYDATLMVQAEIDADKKKVDDAYAVAQVDFAKATKDLIGAVDDCPNL